MDAIAAQLHQRASATGDLAAAIHATLLEIHRELVQDLAQDWSLSTWPVEALHARLLAALPGLRAGIRDEAPALLVAIRQVMGASAPARGAAPGRRRRP